MPANESSISLLILFLYCERKIHRRENSFMTPLKKGDRNGQRRLYQHHFIELRWMCLLAFVLFIIFIIFFFSSIFWCSWFDCFRITYIYHFQLAACQFVGKVQTSRLHPSNCCSLVWFVIVASECEAATSQTNRFSLRLIKLDSKLIKLIHQIMVWLLIINFVGGEWTVSFQSQSSSHSTHPPNHHRAQLIDFLQCHSDWLTDDNAIICYARGVTSLDGSRHINSIAHIIDIWSVFGIILWLPHTANPTSWINYQHKLGICDIAHILAHYPLYFSFSEKLRIIVIAQIRVEEHSTTTALDEQAATTAAGTWSVSAWLLSFSSRLSFMADGKDGQIRYNGHIRWRRQTDKRSRTKSILFSMKSVIFGCRNGIISNYIRCRSPWTVSRCFWRGHLQMMI